MELLEVLRRRSQAVQATAQVDCGALGTLTAQALPLREYAALAAGTDSDRAVLYAACRQLQAAGEQLRREGRLFRPDEIMQFVSDEEAAAGARAVRALSGAGGEAPGDENGSGKETAEASGPEELAAPSLAAASGQQDGPEHEAAQEVLDAAGGPGDGPEAGKSVPKREDSGVSAAPRAAAGEGQAAKAARPLSREEGLPDGISPFRPAEETAAYPPEAGGTSPGREGTAERDGTALPEGRGTAAVPARAVFQSGGAVESRAPRPAAPFTPNSPDTPAEDTVPPRMGAEAGEARNAAESGSETRSPLTGWESAPPDGRAETPRGRRGMRAGSDQAVPADGAASGEAPAARSNSAREDRAEAGPAEGTAGMRVEGGAAGSPARREAAPEQARARSVRQEANALQTGPEITAQLAEQMAAALLDGLRRATGAR